MGSWGLCLMWRLKRARFMSWTLLRRNRKECVCIGSAYELHQRIIEFHSRERLVPAVPAEYSQQLPTVIVMLPLVPTLLLRKRLVLCLRGNSNKTITQSATCQSPHPLCVNSSRLFSLAAGHNVETVRCCLRPMNARIEKATPPFIVRVASSSSSPPRHLPDRESCPPPKRECLRPS